MTREQVIELMRAGTRIGLAAIEDDVRAADLTDDELNAINTVALAAVEACGMVLVPVEPTEAMVKAASTTAKAVNKTGFIGWDAIYRAMIAARPSAAPEATHQEEI